MESPDCIGFTRHKDKTLFFETLSIDTFSASSDGTRTFLRIDEKLPDAGIEGFDSLYTNIDNCCPNPGDYDLEDVIRNINETVPRVPCDISRAKFESEFVRKKKLAILTNCKNTAKLDQKWNVEEFFSTYKDYLWETDWGRSRGRIPILGSKVLDLLRRNKSHIVFERFQRRTNLMRY